MYHAKRRLLITVLGLLTWMCFVPAGAAAIPLAGSAESTATVLPASQRTVHKALRWQRKASRARQDWRRAAACFGKRVHQRVAKRPSRADPDAVWLLAGKRWHRQARDFERRTGRLLRTMRAPGGSSCGARWKPLARHVGWPESQLTTLAYIIQRESSGRANAHNPSGASGLMQLMPGWWTGAWGLPAGNPYDPEYNLRTALLIWHRGGWGAWAL